MLKIWGLYVNGLQNDRPSNFENDSTPDKLESGLTDSSGAGDKQQTFSQDLQFWQLVTLKPFNLQTLFYSIERSKPFKKVYQKSRG